MYGIFPLQEIKSKMNYTKISRQLDDALNQTRVTNVIGLTRNSHNKAARKVFFFFFYNSEFSYNTTTFNIYNQKKSMVLFRLYQKCRTKTFIFQFC
jgi:hypothetical protein